MYLSIRFIELRMNISFSFDSKVMGFKSAENGTPSLKVLFSSLWDSINSEPKVYDIIS